MPRCRPHLLLLLAAMAAASPTRAQLAVDRSEISLHPQVTAERVALVTVTNTGPRAVQAVVRLEDWDRSETGANRWFRAGSVDGSCSALLTAFPLTLALDPGASQSVRLVLPDSAAALTRECWSALMIETVQPPAQRGGMGYVIRSAVKIYVEPSGLAASGEINDMRMIQAPGAPDSVEVWFRNDGARHYVAKGRVEFRRPDNSVAATLETLEYYVLPGARQRVRVAVPALAAGAYAVLAMVDFGGSDIAAMQIEHLVAAPVSNGTPRQ